MADDIGSEISGIAGIGSGTGAMQTYTEARTNQKPLPQPAVSQLKTEKTQIAAVTSNSPTANSFTEDVSTKEKDEGGAMDFYRNLRGKTRK